MRDLLLLALRAARFRALLLVVTLGSIPSLTRAGVLYSDTLSLTAGASDFVCRVTNVSTKPIDVGIAVINSDTGMPHSAVDPTSIAPGAQNTLGASVHANYHCVFTIRGSAKKVRATAELLDGNLQQTVSIPAR
jgi:hypothetical protein